MNLASRGEEVQKGRCGNNKTRCALVSILGMTESRLQNHVHGLFRTSWISGAPCRSTDEAGEWKRRGRRVPENLKGYFWRLSAIFNADAGHSPLCEVRLGWEVPGVPTPEPFERLEKSKLAASAFRSRFDCPKVRVCRRYAAEVVLVYHFPGFRCAPPRAIHA